MGEKIYFWPGDDCNVKEKMKALEYSTNLRKSERHCHSDIVFPKDDEEVDAEFWEHLGGKPDEIAPATSDAVEEEDEAEYQYCLYKISNEDGKL